MAPRFDSAAGRRLASYCHTTMTIDLPDGFDDAPEEMRREMLKSKKGQELADAIRSRCGATNNAAQLSKFDMVEVYLTLRELQEN